MRFLGFSLTPKNINSPDTMGAYPEGMQVKALPERRYMKTARFLTIVILLNLALIMMLAGFVTYVADRVDVSIANRRVVNLYTIDSSRKVVVPAEYEEKVVHAFDLYIESRLQEYIRYRHEIIWDNNAMKQRWGNKGPIAAMSHYKKVYTPFQVEADLMYSDSRTSGFVRDVHLYELKKTTPGMWEGLIDTFDLPIPDSFNPICANCMDNSKECIACKAKHALKRQRFRVFVRVQKNGTPHLSNPLGFLVNSYNTLYVPIREDEKYWGIPSDLKPDL